MNTKAALSIVFFALVSTAIAFSGQIFSVQAESTNSDPPQGWVETRFIPGPSGPWNPEHGEVALCWGEPRFLDVFGPEDVGEARFNPLNAALSIPTRPFGAI